MLVLNRKVGSRLYIGKDICVTILSNARSNRQVSVGIDAPKDVSIVREEIASDELLESWNIGTYHD